jgi:hypothetical protein
MSVSMTVKDGRMNVGREELLFDLNPPVLETVYWDVSADGQRIFTVNTQIAEAPDFCNLVLNWPGILEKR